jgi:hypothetical protein
MSQPAPATIPAPAPAPSLPLTQGSLTTLTQQYPQPPRVSETRRSEQSLSNDIHKDYNMHQYLTDRSDNMKAFIDQGGKKAKP